MRVLPFTKYSPCGNTTILVRESSLSPADRARVAAEIIAPGHLEAEQAGYVDTAAPVPRLDMMGGEFCVNATRAFAALLAEEVKKRRPLLLFFVSAQLLDAANLPEVLEALEPVLAHPAEPVRRITDLRLRVTAQRWVKALCFGLPMPRKTFTPETEETIGWHCRNISP